MPWKPSVSVGTVSNTRKQLVFEAAYPDGPYPAHSARAQPRRFVRLYPISIHSIYTNPGSALVADPPQAPVVAAAILGAKPGTPSLPADLVLNAPKPWTVPASDPTVTKVGVWHKPQYCIPKAGWKDGELPGPDVEPADAGVTDSNGTIPGVDAAGGWNDAGPLQDTAGAPTDTSSTKSGCTAGHAANSAWLALAFAVGFILRRRVNPRGN